MEESLRKQVLGLVDSMRGKHGAEAKSAKLPKPRIGENSSISGIR